MNLLCFSAACATECLNTGGGFCTGNKADDCCPFFNSDTGACVDNCTTIDNKFGPDENFICGEVLSYKMEILSLYIHIRNKLYSYIPCLEHPHSHKHPPTHSV